MRIVIDLQACQNGSRFRGIGRYARSIAQAMIQQGRDHEFVIVLNAAFADTARDVRRAFDGLLPQDRIIAFHPIGQSMAADPSSAWRNRAAEISRTDFLNSLSPDVVFLPSLFEGFWEETVVSVEAGRNHPTAVTLHDLIPLEDIPHYLGDDNGRNAYFRRLQDLRRADLILPVSNYVAGDAQRRANIDAGKLQVVMGGVDPQFQPPTAHGAAADAVLKRLGISRPFVVTAAPLEPRKNIEGMIAGFAAMDADVRDRHQLVMIGKMDDFAKRYIGGLARNEGLSSNAIIFPGYVSDSDLTVLYGYCAAFAFASLSEGFGLPVLEAMACGAPVIGSSSTSIPEVVGRADLLVDPKSAKSIGEGLQRILADPDLQAELKAYGISRARDFSWEKSGFQALAALETLAIKHKRPPVPENSIAAQKSLPSLAIVMPRTTREHLLSGLGHALVAGLAGRFAVTLFSDDDAVESEWIRANCVKRGRADFPPKALAYDHLLFLCDFNADADFLDLIDNYGGAVLLPHSDAVSAKRFLIGPDLGAASQNLLIQAEGFAGLIAAVEAESDMFSARQAVIDAFSQKADALFTERGPGAIGILPIARSMAAATAFRSRIGLPAGSRLLVFMMSGSQSSMAALRALRRHEFQDNDLHIMILAEPSGNLALIEPIERLFGNISKLTMAFEEVYSGLISAVDVLVTDFQESDLWGLRLSADLSSDQHIRWQTDTPFPTDNLEDALDDVFTKAANGLDITGTGNSDRGAAAVGDRLLTSVQNKRDRMRALEKGFPISVREVRPTAGDIVALSRATILNGAHLRPARILIDITAFAGVSKVMHLDRRAKAWLKALFRNAGPSARAVYLEGSHIVEANYFTARMLGVRHPQVRDELVSPRPGDRIIGFDLWPCFGRAHHALLMRGQSLGLSVHYMALKAYGLKDGDGLESLAQAVLAWVWAKAPFKSTLTVLPVSPGIASAPTAIDARISNIVEDGILCHLLATKRPPADWLETHSIQELTLDPEIINAVQGYVDSRSPANDGAISLRQLGHVVTGHLLGSYSLAIINRNLAMALEKYVPGQVRYLPVETVPINHTEGVPLDQQPLMIELSQRATTDGQGEVVISQHYPVLPANGDYLLRLALLAWEESRVPDDIVAVLAENFDAIIAPTEVVARALLDSGLTIPIAAIGQPVNVDGYRALATTRPAGASGKKTFVHISSCFRRKGVDILLAAWGRAFSSSDNVRLVIKTFPNPHNDIEDRIARLGEDNPQLAEIVLINEDVAQEQMPKYYAMADVMVLPSRGEGYNLPALEAMSAGVPLIVTAHGGQRDFCGPAEARLIRCRFAPTESHVGSSHSLWVEPDIDDLVFALREQVNPACAEEIEVRRLAAMEAAAFESDEEAWLNRYDAMLAGLLGRDRPTGKPSVAWISTWGVQCGVAQYSGYLIDHFSQEFREGMTVICDTRTEAGVDPIRHDAVWEVQDIPKVEQIITAIQRSKAEVVVLQHQDGLISWRQLGELAHDERLSDLTTVVILHNAANMMRAGDDERALMLEGLRNMSRVLVHNISDLNLLFGMGLTDNIALFPHGAFAPKNVPWPRELSAGSDPIIGCHGFFFRHKGIDKLIRAGAILRQTWPRLRIRLVNARFPDGGHDAYIAECKALAAQLGMADAVEWHQDFLPIESVNDLLSGCDVIALPYDESDDSASGAVRVALAAMVPLVATRVKIFAELKQAAHWSNTNDPASLAEAIAELLASVDKRRAIQSAMYDWLAAHDWQRVAATLEGMVHGLAEQKRLGWQYGREI